MSNAPEVAMTVIEPGGRRWAQLLDVTWPVSELLALIVSRLDLPEQLNYELQHVRSERVLKSGDTLHGIGIVAGEELQIRPVRNKFLYDLLNKLYDEAVGYVAKQLWGQAESRLETILRLDPEYPDPKGIRRTIENRTPSPGPVKPPPSEPVAVKPAAPSTPTGPPLTTATAAPAPQASAKPRSACAVFAMLLGGIVLVLVILVAAAFAWFTLRSPANTESGTIPTIEDEPILGTGDVQMTLRWDSEVDLDLHVTDPAGEEVWYLSPTSSSGGQLDVDANGTCADDPPVENVYWPTGGAPSGEYGVSVVYYGSCEASGAANYEVTILVDGQTVDVRSGTLTEEGESQFIGNYTR